jgi:hypothetical protein
VPWVEKNNSDVSDAVLRGERLAKPDNCPNELYELMLKCWKANSEERPTFRELLTVLLDFSKTIQRENAAIVQINQQEEPELDYLNPEKLADESLYYDPPQLEN